MKKVVLHFLTLYKVISLIQVPPTWVTSQYIQADNYHVINTFTGNDTTPNATMTFLKSFAQIPNLGYGCSAYQGLQPFIQDMISLLTTTYFSVSVQISGATSIYLLGVRYIAIDLLFPNYLNSFDNVPVNYTYGDLVNISGTRVSTYRTFQNTINYTNQAAGLLYNKFPMPLNSNKILLFMTSFFHSGYNDNSASHTPATYNPVSIQINYSIDSEETYTLQVTIGKNNSVSRLHFSMIIFNVQQVQEKGQYLIQYQRVDFSNSGGFIPFPIQFDRNFILGLTNFSTIRTASVITFSWELITQNGLTGMKMKPSVSRNPTYPDTVNNYGVSYFFLKTWKCMDQTYFDPSINLCTGCPIIHCINCLNLTVCSRCNESAGYYLNESTGTCISCQIQQCSVNQITFKTTNCNQLIIKLQLSNPQKPISQQSIKMITKAIQIKQINFIQNHIEILCHYYQSFTSNPIILSINGIQYSIYDSPKFSTLTYYSQIQCQTKQQIKNLMKAMQIMSYLILFISLISCKIVGLQLFGVLQLSYFSLTSHNFLVLYLDPLSSFKTFNGLNLKLFQETSNLPQSYEYIGLSSYFLNNCNIMLFLMLFELLIAFILNFISQRTTNGILITISKRLLKQGFITLILFNIFNISYSTGIQIKFSIHHSTFSFFINFILLALSLFIIITATTAMQITKQQNYGEFKQKFKNSFVNKIYIPITILYRMSLGIYSSTSQSEETTLIVLAIVLALILYNIINNPFANTYQNYRSNLIHITQLIILLTTNYYRNMKKNTPIEIKAHIHQPALLQLIFIVICVAFSMLALLYQIYIQVKEWKKKSFIGQKTMEINQSQQSFQNLER